MRLLVLLPLLLAAPVLAQPADAPAALVASPEDEVRAAVTRLFDGMRAGDSSAVRAAFHPSARLFSVAERDGETRLMEDGIAGFVEAVGTPHDEVWDERVGAIEVRVDGPLATAWMPYRFYLGERFSHCGVNAMQLARTAAGWQIVAITDTRRREGCVE